MKIGVFDSGVGGLSVANAIEGALPEHQVLFRNDSAHMPYGSKQPLELLELVLPILQQLTTDGCTVIVIACNTVSTLIIDELRQQIVVPLLAMEPMVKPAAGLTKSGVIAVCATPATLASKRYQQLKQTYAKDITVLEPDCSDWSYLVEHEQINEQIIADRLTDVLDRGADVIVLGCTHYHWIETGIVALAAGRAEVLQPEAAVIKQLKQVIKTLT